MFLIIMIVFAVCPDTRLGLLHSFLFNLPKFLCPIYARPTLTPTHFYRC